MTASSAWLTTAAQRIRAFAGDTSGATAIEYGLLTAGIGLAITAAAFTAGLNIKEMLYDRVLAIWGGG